MNITADTNILIRGLTNDNPEQGRLAHEALETADLIAIPLGALCEFVWILQQGYKLTAAVTAAEIRKLLAISTVSVNRPAVKAGLAMLDAGGDFADGVIAYEGRKLGGETFVSFDKQAIKILTARGEPARLLGA